MTGLAVALIALCLFTALLLVGALDGLIGEVTL